MGDRLEYHSKEKIGEDTLKGTIYFDDFIEQKNGSHFDASHGIKWLANKKEKAKKRENLGRGKIFWGMELYTQNKNREKRKYCFILEKDVCQKKVVPQLISKGLKQKQTHNSKSSLKIKFSPESDRLKFKPSDKGTI